MTESLIFVLLFLCEKLEDGDFHDKFGIFYKGEDMLSFSGSINDSKHGYQNYESIKVFKTWAGTGEYVESDRSRFEKIWNGKDKNLKIYTDSSCCKKTYIPTSHIVKAI